MLDRIGAKAHFLQVGQHVQKYPEITKYVAARGHSIGNHSWDHSDFTTLNFDQQVQQISDTNRIIINTIGWIDPFFRYPYGATTQDMNQFLKGEKTEFYGYTSPQTFVVELGLYYRFSPERYVKALIENTDILLNAVNENHKKSGEKIYF